MIRSRMGRRRDVDQSRPGNRVGPRPEALAPTTAITPPNWPRLSAMISWKRVPADVAALHPPTPPPQKRPYTPRLVKNWPWLSHDSESYPHFEPARIGATEPNLAHDVIAIGYVIDDPSETPCVYRHRSTPDDASVRVFESRCSAEASSD